MRTVYPMVECLLPSPADNGHEFTAAFTQAFGYALSENVADPRARVEVRPGSVHLQEMLTPEIDLELTAMSMTQTSDPGTFYERLKAYPDAPHPRYFMMHTGALSDLSPKDSFTGLASINPLNILEGKLGEPFSHKDRLLHALFSLIYGSRKIQGGLIIPTSTEEAQQIQRLRGDLYVGQPISIMNEQELGSSLNHEALAQALMSSIVHNRHLLFDDWRTIFKAGANHED